MKPPLKANSTGRRYATFAAGDIIDSQGFTIAEGLRSEDAKFIAAAVNACHRLGLTTSQLEAGCLEKLVEQMHEVDDCLTEMGWHSDRGVLHRVKQCLRNFTK